MPKPKLLFICTANINRSRTAEDMLTDSEHYEVKSAGIKYHKDGGQVVTQGLVGWADVIILMDEINDHHYTLLLTNFRKDIISKEILVLRIPDIYARGDKNLIDLLRLRLSEFGIRA